MWNELGNYALHSTKYQEAEYCFLNALETISSSHLHCSKEQKKKFIAGIYCNLGVVYQAMGEEFYEQSEKSFLNGIKEYRALPELWNNLGNLYRISEINQKALECYQECVQIDSNYAMAFNNIALLHIKQGDLYEAKFALDSALDIDKDLDSTRSNRKKLEVLFNQNEDVN
ncbi:cell division cycle protein [Anaeramoeba flamelloides]|uniref:Cell division cycle protein n=1 Tax=Anaeramoeba flamelloides TaxID=1746091 RepID=A0AAV8ADJ7_9EUKA|nr:cell division cycle protein 16 [Anaeramoeba flamelloides]KAJ6250689.1 cell division cycle protein [Anaeramoeba flamelloides]